MERAITLPFSINESGGISSSSDPRLIWQSRVTAAVLTELGERVMRPTFGGRIQSSVFETPNSAAIAIKSSVQETFGSYLQDLILNSVNSTMDPQLGTLNVTIDYTLPSGQKDQLTVKTASLTRSGDITQES